MTPSAMDSLEIKLVAVVADLSTDDMQAGPPSKWRIQQIVEHLELTYSATEVVLRIRLAKERPTSSTPGLLQRGAKVMILHLGYFPSGIPAPDAVTPSPSAKPLSGKEVAASAVHHMRQMDALLDEVATAFGPSTRSASHLRLGPLNRLEWRRFHLIHGLHHIRQIEAIRHRRVSEIVLN